MTERTRLSGERYVIERLLGEGAQGATYAATDTQTGRAVAIKRFDVRGARSWKDVELAEREIRVLSSLHHPLVPAYLAHFEEEGALYLVMERVDGKTLESMRAATGAVAEDEVRRFLACAERALSYMHGGASPVVHRDIKPSNVVRTSSGDYVLVDFGSVGEVLRRGASTVVGTAGYMAPEQLQGRAMATSDVYAVGATALAALTGRDPGELPHRGLRIDVRAAVGDRASPDLIAALERMLEPDPDLRAPSVAAALNAARDASARPAMTQPADRPIASGAVNDASDEDAIVKSLRGLLWAIWGLGWVVVPLVFGEMLHMPAVIPIVMFGWMAAILVMSWHRGALLRAGVRWWRAEAPAPEAQARARVVVDAPPIRVGTSELHLDAAQETEDEHTHRRTTRGA